MEGGETKLTIVHENTASLNWDNVLKEVRWEMSQGIFWKTKDAEGEEKPLGWEFLSPGSEDEDEEDEDDSDEEVSSEDLSDDSDDDSDDSDDSDASDLESEGRRREKT